MRVASRVCLAVLSLVLLVCGSAGAADDRAKPAGWRASELRSVLGQETRSNDRWRIAESSRDQDSLARLGTTASPLRIVDIDGRVIGEVYRIEEAGEYRGLAILSNRSVAGLRSGFSTAQWPIERLAQSLKALDADDPLKEPEYRLVIDEDRLLLWVNLGKIEKELEFMPLDLRERRRR